MKDKANADVSIDATWRSTMMGNAARDPYWLATMRAEVIRAPAYQAIIEDKCATCHTPMARFTDASGGREGVLFDAGYLNESHELHPLALDGVSCTVCHQIEEANLGQPGSYSGHYEIDIERPMGERVNYGPFPVTEEAANLMALSSGFTPKESRHIKQATLCATCHTLYTPYLDAAGEIAGEFPEQTPFLEWKASKYHGVQSCQNCHMPSAEGGVVLSITGGEPQQPFSQHHFVGGNAFMLNILRTFPDERGVTAGGDHFAATLARVEEQLASRTATVAIENVTLSGQSLTIDVAIANLAGHKFPTGFPSRRTWLHLAVTDAQGMVVFESGAVNADGAITGNDNDADEGAFEPHYTTITDADQVQIYEAVMRTVEWEVTTTLLRGAGYGKDNRLLPAGFDKEKQLGDVAVHGEAFHDADFIGGGDRVRYQIDVGAVTGPFTLRVELLYQTVGHRWAMNLSSYDAVEVADFMRYYAAIPNLPVIVAQTSLDNVQ